MRRIQSAGLCLVAALAVSVLGVQSASAAPQFYWKAAGKLEPIPEASKVTFTTVGGESHWETPESLTCRSDTGKGDIEGATKIVKVKIVFKECHISGTTTPCGKYTNATVGGEIKTEPIKGELTEASETSGGELTVAERLEPEKTLLAKFNCGLTGHTQLHELRGGAFAAVAGAVATPEEAALSKEGATSLGEKGVIAGCGGQKFLYEVGSTSCLHLIPVEGETELEPSWILMAESVTYKTAIEVVE